MPDIFVSRRDHSEPHSHPVGEPVVSTVENAEVPEDQALMEAGSDAEILAGHVAEDTPKSNIPHRHVDDYSEVMRTELPTGNPFKAYAAKPVRTFFDTQLRNEHVLLLLRQHPVTQIKWLLVAFVLVLLPYLFSFVGFLSFLPQTFHVVATIGWYMLVLGFSLEAFLSWFYNVYIITDERVIDVDFTSLLFKHISYAKIDKIENISATTSGALGAIFDYGTVKIQTAAGSDEFDFEHVPHPSRVTAFLNELIVEEERERIEGRVE